MSGVRKPNRNKSRFRRSGEVTSRYEKPRFCDPSACVCCEYVGRGNFVCNKDPLDPIGVEVVTNWEATPQYLYCKRRRGR